MWPWPPWLWTPWLLPLKTSLIRRLDNFWGWRKQVSRPQNWEMICYSRVSGLVAIDKKYLITTFEDYSMDPGSRHEPNWISWVHVTMFHVNCCFSIIFSYPRCFNLNMIRRQVSANLPDVFIISMINHRKSPGICGGRHFCDTPTMAIFSFAYFHKIQQSFKDRTIRGVWFLALALLPFWVDFDTPGVILPSMVLPGGWTLVRKRQLLTWESPQFFIHFSGVFWVMY